MNLLDLSWDANDNGNQPCYWLIGLNPLQLKEINTQLAKNVISENIAPYHRKRIQKTSKFSNRLKKEVLSIQEVGVGGFSFICLGHGFSHFQICSSPITI